MLIDWDVGADLDASDAEESLTCRTVSSAAFSTIVRVSLRCLDRVRPSMLLARLLVV